MSLQNILSPGELSKPIYAVSPPGDSERLFIVEQDTGAIKIYDRSSGNVLADPFLTVDDLRFNHPEEGAQSIAFAPDYATSGLFYVSVVNAAGDHEVIEYSVSAGDPNIADAASARSIITIDHPDNGGNGHFGGWVDFGPDNYLYISTGDSNDDPINAVSQDRNNLLGSILRIDPRADDFASDHTKNYGVPSDNPFVGADGDPAIWAYGARNPFRPSFDKETGVLYIADVGEDRIEEINIGAPGANYGWPGYEGSAEFDITMLADPAGDLRFPIYEYLHGDGPFEGFSITGGGVYRGVIEELHGLYFFGDFVANTIWSFRYNPMTETISELTSWAIAAEGGVLSSVSSFAFDADGNMYVLDILTGNMFLVTSAISDVPLPAALWLFAAGSAGMVRMRAKRK
ncbi:MAG: PQQ-dependent sugar dehydrogenase [Pseudomonadota bacterium]